MPRIDKWKCSRCGIEFEPSEKNGIHVHHHEEFDLCDTCHELLISKRVEYDQAIEAMREEKKSQEEVEEKQYGDISMVD